jgi:DNA mismatch endonuclease Vsr
MRTVKSRGTTPEKLLIKAIKTSGLIGWRREVRGLLGRPDIVFRVKRVLIFVDGCFWHGCIGCYRGPKSNRHYWRKKLRLNRARDQFVNSELLALKWRVVRLWEHEVKTRTSDCVDLINKTTKLKLFKTKVIRL